MDVVVEAPVEQWVLIRSDQRGVAFRNSDGLRGAVAKTLGTRFFALKWPGNQPHGSICYVVLSGASVRWKKREFELEGNAFTLEVMDGGPSLCVACAAVLKSKWKVCGACGAKHDNPRVGKKKRDREAASAASSSKASPAALRHPTFTFSNWSKEKTKRGVTASWKQHGWLIDESKKVAEGDRSFSVVSWNCLAPAYCFNHFYKHLRSPEKTLKWSSRAFMIFETLRGPLSASIYCFQEVEMADQFSAELNALGYESRFFQREGPKMDGLMICWSRTQFSLVVGSCKILSFNDALGMRLGQDRVAAKLILTHTKSGARVLVSTTHLDYKRKEAQLEMGRLYRAFLEESPEKCAVATGDFNCNPYSETVSAFLAGSNFHSALPHEQPNGDTFVTAYTQRADHIDFVFYSAATLQLRGITQPMPETPLPHDEYPSDHYAVGAMFTII